MGITLNAFVVHPSLPAIAESGVPGYDYVTWYGLLVPGQTPKHVVARLSASITKTLALPEVREKLGQGGVEPEASTPESFGKLVQDDIDKWRKIIRAANVKAE